MLRRFIIATATVAALGISFGATGASAAPTGTAVAMEAVTMEVGTEAVAGVVARDCSAARS